MTAATKIMHIAKPSLLLFILLFFHNYCYGDSLVDTDNFSFSIDTYLRLDSVSLKNTVDLDSRNHDDHATYLGLDYGLSFKSEFKDADTELFFRLERNGPSDYDAPLFAHNTLMTSGGVIEEYRNDELLPGLEEFWVDAPLRPGRLRVKAGLYTYEVGNGFSLNGGFENYGFTIYRQVKDFSWRLYYCRPDLVYKNHLGPRIRQDQEQGYIYNHGAANFFAADVRFTKGSNCFNPYIGVLTDYTSGGKRNNSFTAGVRRDILGAAGLAWMLEKEKLSFNTEIAHNFGKAESTQPEFKNIYHTGYLVYTDMGYRLGKFKPALRFLLCSGNEISLDETLNQNTTLSSGKNKAFSYYSPSNSNLSDAISSVNSQARPIVAMGAGYGQNNGIPRPGTFSSSDFDNLIMPSLGFEIGLTDKLSASLEAYYLRSFSRPSGTLNGEARYLSPELAYEADLCLDYKLNKNTLLSFLGGYFIPGKYYKELRDDTAGSLLSPYLSGDGIADFAYQIELAAEFQF